MKKILAFIFAVTFAFTAKAQTEVKVKKTSSPTQKVHNVFSKNKKYNGVKVKHKTNGRKRKVEVKTTPAKVEVKNSTFLWRKEEATIA